MKSHRDRSLSPQRGQSQIKPLRDDSHRPTSRGDTAHESGDIKEAKSHDMLTMMEFKKYVNCLLSDESTMVIFQQHSPLVCTYEALCNQLIDGQRDPKVIRRLEVYTYRIIEAMNLLIRGEGTSYGATIENWIESSERMLNAMSTSVQGYTYTGMPSTTFIGYLANFVYWPTAIHATPEEVNDLFSRLVVKDKIKFRMMGRVCVMQRRQMMFGEHYKFSNQTIPAETTPNDLVQKCLAWATERYGHNYNAALVNLYMHGKDYISLHSDDEKQHIGGPILTFSFGATRTMRIRSKKGKVKDKTQIRVDIPLKHGSCGAMVGANFQTKFKHGIPIQPKVTSWRISVTVRQF